MVEKGHFEELHKILEMINSGQKEKARRQNFVFSATLSLVHNAPTHVQKKRGKKLTSKDKLQEVMDLVGVKESCKVIDLTTKASGGSCTAETLSESRINCSLQEKDVYLYYLTQMHRGRTLVFCNSIDCVRRLVNLFTILKTKPHGLHADMRQKQRLKSLEKFADSDEGLLIATDVAARGLDIKDVQHVVHYQVPRTSESYVHRSGRTARASKEGLSVMLIDAQEMHLYKKMSLTLGREEDLPLFPVDQQALAACKDRLSLARDIDKMKLSARKREVGQNWWKKAAQEADLVLSDQDSDEEEVVKSESVSVKERALNALLARPVSAGAGYWGKYPTASGKLNLPKEFTGQNERSAVEKLNEEVRQSGKVKKRKKAKERK